MANTSRIADRSRSIPIPIQRFGTRQLSVVDSACGDTTSSSDDDDDENDQNGRRNSGLDEEFTGLSLGFTTSSTTTATAGQQLSGSVPARHVGIHPRRVHRPSSSLPPNAPLLVSRGSGEQKRYVTLRYMHGTCTVVVLWTKCLFHRAGLLTHSLVNYFDTAINHLPWN